MAAYEAVLLKKVQIAKGISEFRFSKPQGFIFKAGQYIVMTLEIEHPDEKGKVRTFSICSSPNREYIAIATKIRDSSFKKALDSLSPGAKAKIMGPAGVLLLPDRDLVMITGGIGVTPFKSMIEYASEMKAPHVIYLFYSNKTIKEAAYLDEFEQLSKANRNFVFVPTLTQGKPDDWTHESGRIDAEMLRKHIKTTGNLYYITGPPAMVDSLYETTVRSGVRADEIKREGFTGY